ncbi:MAG: rhodanese-like domain-containing protein [Bacteroidetes bacterium]|nr:rhodanese-like domain-containing protein [Bacteroidota bacterium]
MSEAYDILKKDRNSDDLVLLDVRSPREYNSGHLSGSRQINFIDRNFKDQLAELAKDKKYIVYCQSGGRSEVTVKYMKDMGFREAHNIEGGLSEWQSENLPLETGK